MESQNRNDRVDLGALLIETGTTMASLILFPALAQRLKVSPVMVNAVKIALRNRKIEG